MDGKQSSSKPSGPSDSTPAGATPWDGYRCLQLGSSLLIVVFCILTFTKVDHLHRHHVDTTCPGSLTFSTGMELEMLLDNSASSTPIGITLVYGTAHSTTHIKLALSLRSATGGSMIEFAVSPNSYCSDETANLHLGSMELSICSEVISMVFSRDMSILGPTTTVVWTEDHCDRTSVTPVTPRCQTYGYTNCIYTRSYPNLYTHTHN